VTRRAIWPNLTPYLARHRIRFKLASPGTRLLVEQLRDVPNTDHDALEMAIRLAATLLEQQADEEDPFTTEALLPW
jgi:hypothetical protein